MASIFDLKKKVVTFNEDNTQWSWKAFSIKSIVKSPAYAHVKVAGKPIKDFVLEHRNSLSKGDKQLLWNALDEASKDRIKSCWSKPEVKIASAYKTIAEDDTIVAFFEHQSNYYHGEEQTAELGYYYTTFDKNGYGIEREQIIFNTNSELHFSNYMETSPAVMKWLPKVIALAKYFDITPKWQECIHSGKRGLGLTMHDAKELQACVNWYEGNAELGADYSDLITLHHVDGIHTAVISQREYKSNQDVWLDWKEIDCYDFQAPLHEDEESI